MTTVADTGFLVASLNRRDRHHAWALAQGRERPPPWRTCDAVLVEAFHLLGSWGAVQLATLLHRKAVVLAFSLTENIEPVLSLMEKYDALPMSLADACLVRMSELLPEPVVLTTDSHFRRYRRHSRQVVPCMIPD